MDFRQLDNFVEVCEQMSFTKAANNLYISQQGVSKSIRALEDELGAALFFRMNSSISLTNYGMILLRYARGLVKDHARLLGEINEEKNRDQSVLTVGFPHGIVNFLPEGLLDDYLQQGPEAKLSIREYNDIEVDRALARGDIDIGFCVSPIDDRSIKIHHTHSVDLYFMLSESHPMANESSIDLRKLKNDCFIAFGDEGKGHASFLERCRKAGFFPNIGVRVSDMGLMMALCRKGLGIGVYAGDRAASIPGLKIVPDKLHGWEYSINICTSLERGVTSQEAGFIRCFRKW